MRRWALNCCFVIALTLAAAGSQATAAPHGTDVGTALIAMVAPMTGPVPYAGEAMSRAAVLAVAEINRHGGVAGKKLRFSIGDGQCSAGQATTAAQQLLTQHPVMVLGEYCSASAAAVQTLTEAAHVPDFIVAAISPVLRENKKYTIALAPQGDQASAALAKFYGARFRSIYHVYENTQAGQIEANTFEATLNKMGKTYHSVAVETTLPDFSSIMLRARAANPDLVVLSMTAGQILKAVQAAKAVGLKAQLASVFWPPPVLFQQAGSLLDGFMWLELAPPGSPEFTAFSRAYQKRWNQPVPHWMSATTYDSVMLWALAARRAKSTDPAKVNVQLHKIRRYRGASGFFGIAANGQAGFSGRRILVVRWDNSTQKAVPVK
jgi:branched-chain amino acid transport system substrate-binding protein